MTRRAVAPLRVALVVAAVLCPLAVLGAVWLPVYLHYRVATPVIGPETVARLREQPSDELLAHLEDARYGMILPDADQALAAAEEVLGGRYRARGGEVIRIDLEPTPRLLTTGSPMAQLQVSSLVPQQVLLDAWRRNGEVRYLDAALRSTVAWARFERAARLPVGFLWNDHAIAARVVVLTELWREYRQRPDFDPATAAEILAFVARSATFLARDSHYTARTNHGIMQNLALLHIAAAFPGLPGTDADVGLAINRLTLQVPYYVSPNGIVLEHSAGYQDFAIRLMHFALDYARILGLQPPAGLAARYTAARCFRLHFTRPDGTVPSYGDTSSIRPGPIEPPAASDGDCVARRAWIDEDFGYASLRGFAGETGQLFATWADFTARAHKHDDELAVWLWLDSRDWWAGSGYWPYGDPSRRKAVSWRGANAPHAVGEKTGTSRASRLLGQRAEGPVPCLDKTREGPDGAAYRRQVAGLGATGVLVLDSAAGNGESRFETAWTLVPGIGVRAEAAGAGDYQLIDVTTGQSLRVRFFGGDGQTIERLRGSRNPFGGLVALEGEVHAVETLLASAPTGSWSGSLWTLPATGASAGNAEPQWQGPESWSVAFATPAGRLSLRREGDLLTLEQPGSAAGQLPILAVAAMRPALDQATAQYQRVSARYPVFRDYFKYRLRATLALGILFAGQWAGLWLLGRLGMGPGTRVLLVLVAWSATGWWLYDRYLV